jgi:hypothetical protein
VKVKRSQEKRWVILFCSMSVRAIHLEIVRSIDADSFIMSLRRFVARRGEVKHLYSDPGTNFVGASREIYNAIRELRSSDPFGKYLSVQEIEFHFMPPKGSHFGGAWERLIKSVKRSMRIVLQQHTVHEDTFYTVLCEIENVLNSRPLSYVNNDHSHPTPLTPNHFLHHAGTTVSPINAPNAGDNLSRKRWRQSQLISEHLWRRWRREYLPTLTVRRKWLHERRSLRAGDVVMIVDNNAPRGSWPLARVIEAIPGRDDCVRSVRLKTTTGELVRPASCICLLEESD